MEAPQDFALNTSLAAPDRHKDKDTTMILFVKSNNRFDLMLPF